MILPTQIFPVKGRVRIFLTGGTIDAAKVEKNGTYYFSKTHLPKMLRQARMNKSRVWDDVLMLKDSHYNTENDRKLIFQSCKAAKERRILIFHGTGTIVLTAAYLAKNFDPATLRSKTIVLLGAIIPYVEPNSDAMFNFGCGQMAAQLLPPGIYIVMNGDIFNWNNVIKNNQGIFQIPNKRR
jgi:L-asparaginase